MYLKKNKSGKRIHLLIVDGYYDKETKRVRTVTVKTLGYLDELQKQYPDPLVHFQTEVDEMNRQKAIDSIPAAIKFNKHERLVKDSSLRKNIGYAALSRLYHDLKLPIFFNNISRRWESQYSINSIMRLLVFSRILDPASKMQTYNHKEMYIDKTDFTLADIYRCLSQVIQVKSELTAHLHKSMNEEFGRTGDVVYYDVTNFYFEIDEQDELRRRGVSKEHRPDPIIQMGLLTDSQGIPITFDTFPGNTLDCQTYLPLFKQVRGDFTLGRIIIVADKGLNTADNIAHCILSGNGYVLAQKIRNSNQDLQDFVLDPKGYRTLDDGFKIKSRLYPRTLNVTDICGKKQKVNVDEKQVIFYSPDYAKKAKFERSELAAKARDLVANPSKYQKATAYGAAKYVKNLVFDEKSGEILIASSKPILDEAKLIEEELLDGYYAIVTSEWKKTDEDILDIYRGLWQIEDAFRICKGDLQARPIYLSRPERINAHLMVCFISLVISRLLVRALDNQFSISRIASSLARASGSHMGQNWYVFDHTDEVTKAIHEKMGIDLGRKYMTRGDIRSLIGDTKK